MAKKLDASRIENARKREPTVDRRERERQRIKANAEYNKSGQSQLTVIEPNISAEDEAKIKKLRVGAYVRVSTQEEAQVGSFEYQIKHFEEEIRDNPRYEKVKIYSDEGISGTQVCKRKGFLEMVEDAKAGKLDLILTKSITRFGRNAADILSTLQLLDSLNPPIPVIFETNNINTADGTSKILISVMAALSELESQLKSEAIKGGILYRMQDGSFRFSVKNLLGFDRTKDGVLYIVEEEAEIIRYIYREFIDGASPDEIAQALTESGISSPMHKPVWRPQAVKSILFNEKYCGDVLFQKTYTTSYITHKSKRNNGILRQYHWTNRHDPIIPKDEWNVAQELLRLHKWSKKKTKIAPLKRRFIVQQIKSGRLAGYYLIDPNWNKEERKQFLNLIKSVLYSRHSD